jgi:hypothetical protein
MSGVSLGIINCFPSLDELARMPGVTITSIMGESIIIVETTRVVLGDSETYSTISSLGFELIMTGLTIDTFPLSCRITYFTSLSLEICNGVLATSVSYCIFSGDNIVEFQTPSTIDVIFTRKSCSRLSTF